MTTINSSHAPVRHMTVFDGICVIVGIVIGAGIFKAPSLVAMFAGSLHSMMAVWILGGLLCLCGALCYAELTMAYPRTGGEYVYLRRAFGGPVGFMFVWARSTVIQTGAIAAVAYVFGDYVASLTRWSDIALLGWTIPASMVFALLATVGLTACNVVGLRAGAWTQNLLTMAKVAGLAAVVVVGLLAATHVVPPAEPSDAPAAVADRDAEHDAARAVEEPASDPESQPLPADMAALAGQADPPAQTSPAQPATAAESSEDAASTGSGFEFGFGMMGLAMIFVLYTFGGWNESAYVAGEMRRRRDMLWVLMGSMAVITALYLLVNLAYYRVLGIAGMAGSDAVAADAMMHISGDMGRIAVSLLVAVSALGALDGCIFTGSRAMSALGEDYTVFRPLARWSPRFRTPGNALALQGGLAAVLVILPAMPGLRNALGPGFGTAVEYTAPAFWFFLLLTGIAVIVLRIRDPHVERPFRVPLLPVVLPLFCLMSGWMLYRSLDYRLGGAVVGVVVLLAGVPVYLLCRRKADGHGERTAAAG